MRKWNFKYQLWALTCASECQVTGSKIPAGGSPRDFAHRECFAPLRETNEITRRASLALQRQLRKFYILVIIFAILVKFRAKFCNILNFEILSFSDVSAMIFHHFWLICNIFEPLALLECKFWNFHFQAACHDVQTGPKFSIYKKDPAFKLRQ